jgi:hypothetical protein
MDEKADKLCVEQLMSVTSGCCHLNSIGRNEWSCLVVSRRVRSAPSNLGYPSTLPKNYPCNKFQSPGHI